LNLSENPNRFLSTVQIGITLVGIIAGALGSGRVAGRLAEVIAPVPYIGEYSGTVALAIVISIITYLSLVIGELVPKRLAMKFPEPIASRMAGLMAGISTIASPVVSLLSWSTGSLLRLFGIRDSEDSSMSREELTVLVREGVVTGSINRAESRMMQGVIGFDKLVTYDIMIPRGKIVWIERQASHADVWPSIIGSTQEVFPIYDDQRDRLVGVVAIKDIYQKLAAGEQVSFGDIMQAPLMVPETQKASVLLESFRKTGQRAAFVIDEFGSAMGMVTLIDLMETIVGDVPSKEEQAVMPIQQRSDGSWLIDGLFEIEKLPEFLDGFEVPEGGGDEYQTVSGWLVKELGRLPTEQDKITANEWTFEVIDMDRTRVDKLLASRNSSIEGDR
jgi:putative hemolysin